MNPLLQSLALERLQFAINRAIQLDPGSTQRLAELEGRRFALQLHEPTLFLSLTVRSGELLLGPEDSGEFDTRLSGNWSEFAHIAAAENPAAALINGDVTISGDTAPLLALHQQLGQLKLDWERPLASAFGDVVAHQIGRGVRAGNRWLRQSAGNLRRQVEDFLLEESRLLPHPLEAEDFFAGVDALRSSADRADARLRRLEQRVRNAISAANPADGTNKN